MKILAATALAGAAFAHSSSLLPQVDLGYEIYRASGFNVSHRSCMLLILLLTL